MEPTIHQQRMAHHQHQRRNFELSALEIDQQYQYQHMSNCEIDGSYQNHRPSLHYAPQPIGIQHQHHLTQPQPVASNPSLMQLPSHSYAQNLNISQNLLNPRSHSAFDMGIGGFGNRYHLNSHIPSDMIFSSGLSHHVNPTLSSRSTHTGINEVLPVQQRHQTQSGSIDLSYDRSQIPESSSYSLLNHANPTPHGVSFQVDNVISTHRLPDVGGSRFSQNISHKWTQSSTQNLSQRGGTGYLLTNNSDRIDIPTLQPAQNGHELGRNLLALGSNAANLASSFDISSLLKVDSFSQNPSRSNNLQVQYGYGPPSPAIGAPYNAGFMQPFPSILNVMGPSISTLGYAYIPTIQTPNSLTPFGQAADWSTGLFPPNNSFIPTRSSIQPGLVSSGSSLLGSGDTVNLPLDRDMLMIRANRVYMSLVALSNISRRNSIKKSGGDNNGVAQRQAIYPKPPRAIMSSGSSTLGNKRSLSVHNTGSTALSSHMNPPPTTVSNLAAIGYASQFPILTGTVQTRNVGGGAFSSHTAHPVLASATGIKNIQNPLHDAQTILDLLTNLCEQDLWKWADGMIMGGCLHFGLGRVQDSSDWFRRVIELDSSRVEAISNYAITLYIQGNITEAERLWLQALKLAPDYLDSTEHLFGLVYTRRGKEAVDVINYMQDRLRVTPDTVRSELDQTLGVGSSGYRIPDHDHGRLIGLIHAKGSLFYALKDTKSALNAFEETVLISCGRQASTLHDLVRDIQTALAPISLYGSCFTDPATVPLLLRPETARSTAQLVFSSSGVLPGLSHVPEGQSRRVAMFATSGSLLSLAKILQDSLASGISYTSKPANVGDILALYYLSLSLQESPSTANNVGILLATVQQSAGLPMNHAQIPPTKIAGVTPGSGLSFALAYYEYGLKLDPRHVHLHTNLGSLLKDVGQLDLAISVYERAVSCDDTFDIALTNLANAVKDRGRIQDAITYYKKAVQANPTFAEAVCGLFTALGSVCDWAGRGGSFLRSGMLDRWHVDDHGLLVDALQHQKHSGLTEKVMTIVHKQLADASHWGKGLITESLVSEYTQQAVHLLRKPEYMIQLASKIRQAAGTPFEGSQIVRLVERFSRMAMWQWYHDRLAGCERPASAYSRLRVPPSLTVPTTPTVLPFHTFTCPLDASEVRMISQRNAMRISCLTLRSSWLPTTVFSPPHPPNPRLIVGYISSDFNNHPLAHLMQSVFGFHDRSKVLAICYATTPGDGSCHRQQIEREAPRFRDVSSWSSERIVQQIVHDGCHIIVNLNGYTRGARNDIFAARPAPIQMSFMGFAGTMGAEWCDYLLADESAVPRETLRPCRDNINIDTVLEDRNDQPGGEWIYSENLVYCRDTFFCCDHAQSAPTGERDVTWEQEQQRRWTMRQQLFPKLSDDVIIMGNFNQLYKIDPTTFRTWLRILAQCPKAVLWLLRFPELGEHNIRKTAIAWCSHEVAERIIFTDVAQKQDHISRARVCDVFLDTAECNAHTTAADILWSSTPLITLPRYKYKMCSRIASSILRGALPKNAEGIAAAADLIASSEDEYEKLAVKLVGSLQYTRSPRGYCIGNGRLADLRQLLFNHKWECGLFNTRRWVSDLEESYALAWDHWVNGATGDIDL